MIVPRAFSAQSHDLSEKLGTSSRSTRHKNNIRSKSPFAVSSTPISTSPPNSTRVRAPELRSDPVTIPTRNSKHVLQSQPRPAPVPIQKDAVQTQSEPKLRKDSVQDLLSATSIPARRKFKGRPSQRLPNCNYVADFSRLLMEDMKPVGEGNLTRNNSNSQLDGLFGNIDGLMEGQMIVGSDSVDESVLSIRSPSESDASLASPDDLSTCEITSLRSLTGRSFQEKPARLMASSEDCVSSHPLLFTEAEDVVVPPITRSPPSKSPPPTGGRLAGSLRSSLTASLKAIKSAAHSVSSKTSLFSSHDSDHLARSFFDIQPSLTDDKRPPPNSRPPSPELRRYLNPYTSTAPPDSPAQLHFWQDDGHLTTFKQKKTKSKSRKKSSRYRSTSPPSLDSLPPVVQLSTCLPPSIRTAHASSPPIWLAPDGTPSNKQTAIPLLYDPEAAAENAAAIPRTREPRENRDFLRIFVCEMEMRRRGKLSDDLNAGRAKLWLPPVGDAFNKPRTSTDDPADTGKPKNAGERWTAWSPDAI